MIKKVFSIIGMLSIMSINLQGQTQKNDFVVETVWSVKFKNQGDDLNSLGDNLGIVENDKRNRFETSNELSFCLTNNFAIGLAFEYISEKKEKIAIGNFISPFSTEIQREKSERLETYKSIMPGIVLKRYTNLFKKFQIVSTIGFYHEKESYTDERLATDNGNTVSSIGARNNKNINAMLSNSIAFYLSDNIGVKLSVMDLTSRTRYFDSLFPPDQQPNRTTKFDLEVNPLNWRYGFIIVL